MGCGTVPPPGGSGMLGRVAGITAASASSPTHFIRRSSSAAVQSEANVSMPVRIGRYPVQRQRLPSKASWISRFVGSGRLLSRPHMVITNPVVQ